MNRRACFSVMAAAAATLVLTGPLHAQQEAAPDTTASADTIPSGVQGAPNPLQDDRKYLTGDDLVDESFPNSIPIPGSRLRFRVGGYVKVDFIQDFDYVGDRYEFLVSSIAVDGTPEAALGGRTTVHAKQTRLNFDFRNIMTRGDGVEIPLQVFLEMDFFEDNPAIYRQPRLRHAYGVVGRLLAGQTWNTSGDLEALPGMIDFSGGDAVYGDRVAQIRWQDNAGESWLWAVAVEDPKTAIGNPLELGGVDRANTPNIAAKLRWQAAGGSHLQLGGDLFRLNWAGGDSGPSDSEVGFGLNLTGRLLTGAGNRNALVGGGTVGRGSAHRVVVLEAEPNDAVITNDGLDVMSHLQAYAGYSHYWSDSWNSTISVNWASLDNSDLQPGSSIHRAASFHANLIWFPTSLASTGLEVMWGERTNKDGASGQAWRVQYMAKFKFN